MSETNQTQTPEQVIESFKAKIDALSLEELKALDIKKEAETDGVDPAVAKAYITEVIKTKAQEIKDKEKAEKEANKKAEDEARKQEEQAKANAKEIIFVSEYPDYLIVFGEKQIQFKFGRYITSDKSEIEFIKELEDYRYWHISIESKKKKKESEE